MHGQLNSCQSRKVDYCAHSMHLNNFQVRCHLDVAFRACCSTTHLHIIYIGYANLVQRAWGICQALDLRVS